MNQHETGRPAHPVPIRIMHWIGVYAMGCMIFSGLEIYNASPSLPLAPTLGRPGRLVGRSTGQRQSQRHWLLRSLTASPT